MLHREKYISLLLTILFFTSLITGMEMPSSPVSQVPIQQLKQRMVHGPAQSLLALCCKKVANEWVQIDELDEESFENIKNLGLALRPEMRQFLVQEIAKQPKFLCTIPNNGKFNLDGSSLLSCSHSIPGLYLYDTITGKERFALDGESLYFYKHRWSPRNTYIVAENAAYSHIISDFRAFIWRAVNGKLLYKFFSGHTTGNIKFTSNDEYVLIKELKRPWYILNMQSGRVFNNIGECSQAIDIPAQDPITQWILIRDRDETESVMLDVSALENDPPLVTRLGTVPGKVIDFSPNGSLFMSWYYKEYTLYNRSFELLHRFEMKSSLSRARIDTDNQRICLMNCWNHYVYNLQDYQLLTEYQERFDCEHIKVFPSYDFSKIIMLTNGRNTTGISVYAGEKKLHTWEFQKMFDSISYTADNQFVILVKSNIKPDHKSMPFQLINIETGHNMPLSNYEPIDLSHLSKKRHKFISSNGKFVKIINGKAQVWQLAVDAQGKWQLPIEVDPEKTKTMPLEDIMKLVLAYNKKTED